MGASSTFWRDMEKSFALGVLFILSAVSPVIALAQSYPPIPVVSPPNTTGPISSVGGGSGSIISFVNNMLAWLATLFWILAVIFVFYAAFLYLTAAGDETKVETASHVLWYAVIAIVVGLLAYGLPVLVKNILGGA